MSTLKKTGLILILFLVICFSAISQKIFSYEKQKSFIPTELGQVYLGMSFKNFTKLVDLKKAEADARFGWLELRIPFKKGNIVELFTKVQGVEEMEQNIFLREEKVMKKSDFDESEYETMVNRVMTEKVPAASFVYQIDIVFKKGFDLENYAVKKYGKPGDVYKPGDDYHIYDMQWSKKTTDGLVWLIRYHRSTNALQLIGRIDGTEWDPNS